MLTMTEQTGTKQNIVALLDQIEDEEALILYEKSLRKLAKGEGNDLESLRALKDERKQLRNEKDKIYNIISYHLGSPLRTLQALSNMVMMDAPRLEKKGILEFNEHLNSQIAKLQDLMGNLIEWSSLMVKNYQVSSREIALFPMITKSLEPAKKQIENKQLTIDVAVAEDIMVYFDPRMLQIVIDNLISNALKFSNKDGQVRIIADDQDETVLIRIQDEGIGMSGSKLKNIFNPSRKATQRGTANELGLGMGLIVAKAFLEENGAVLQVDSEKESGTTFSFILKKQAPAEIM